jgi:hypothetical protein
MQGMAGPMEICNMAHLKHLHVDMSPCHHCWCSMRHAPAHACSLPPPPPQTLAVQGSPPPPPLRQCSAGIHITSTTVLYIQLPAPQEQEPFDDSQASQRAQLPLPSHQVRKPCHRCLYNRGDNCHGALPLLGQLLTRAVTTSDALLICTQQ